MSSVLKQTLLEAVQASLTTAGRHAPGEVAPAAILWPDADGQWRPIIVQLQTLMPQLILLGDYAPALRQGPAIWARCVIERALPEVPIPEQAIPVIYLPNVSRQNLRAVETCPDNLKPLVELQYRGMVWCQRNGKDWTVEAFLVSEDAGLELDVAKDGQTRRAMLGALAQLAVTPVSRLREKRLEAEDFDKLMVEDTPRNLLEWMDDPRGTREKWDDARWAAFRARCKAEYSIDPDSDGDLTAGEHMGVRDGAWQGVWLRFSESPALYSGIPDLLRRAKPSKLIFDKEPWPSENDEAEKSLRKALVDVGKLSAAEARTRVGDLESQHAVRRGWVWARLGQSPLAKALGHLATLAKQTSVGLGGDSLDAMADLYTHGGCLADDAVLRALSEVKSAEDGEAVGKAARAVYLPWLQDAAEHFQKLTATTPLPARGSQAPQSVVADEGTCILFVDGLRYDLGLRLAGLSEDRKLRSVQTWRWAAAPTVTGTSKPAVSPAAEKIIGHRLPEDFVPEIADAGQPVTPDRLKKLLAAAGYQCLSASEAGRPQDAEARGWTEYGQFDKLGHDLQAKMAARIDEQLELLVERIHVLLSAGWRQVRVVTDHGWLLVPGGLPAMSLPKYLTESRWSRCASIKPGGQVSAPTAGWYWNPTEVFAFAPGAHCFGGGVQYAHGGISPQECVLPDITFSLDVMTEEVAASITDVQWLGLRCRVTVKPANAPVKVDIRTKVGDPGSSITAPKPLDSDGKTGLLIEDESLAGTTVSVVLVDASGRVVHKVATTVGGEE